jgi:hypothetical protein
MKGGIAQKMATIAHERLFFAQADLVAVPVKMYTCM